MTDIFQMVADYGGRIVEQNRARITEATYKYVVKDGAKLWGIGCFFFTAIWLFIINSLIVLALDIYNDTHRILFLTRPTIEWFYGFILSAFMGIFAYLVIWNRGMDRFHQLIARPTMRTAEIPEPQISPESDAMEATGANTQVSTIPYNTAQNSGHLPRQRGDVRVRGYLFFGALLDALQQGLTRDWLRDEWWPGYLERHPDTKYTFNYDAMRDALEAATFIYQPARNQGYKWTRAGAEWIKGAGYTTPPMEAER